MYRAAAVTLVLLATALSTLAQEVLPRRSLFTFDKTFDVALLQPNGARGELGDGVLRVIAPAGKGWPGVMVKAADGRWDLSLYEYISVDIHNIDTHDIDVYVRVDSPRQCGQDKLHHRTHRRPARSARHPDHSAQAHLQQPRSSSRA